MLRALCRVQACSSAALSRRAIATHGLRYEHYGDPIKVLQPFSSTLPDTPDHGQVLVRMLMAPVNPADLNQIEGVYAIQPPLPAVAGNEGVGEVAAVGDGVSSLRPGDRVICIGHGLGTFCSHVQAGENAFHKIAHTIPVDAAATIKVNPPTAYRMLHDFVRLTPGDTVIQNGATSAVGQAVIQIAKSMGIRTINIIRDREDLTGTINHLTSLGADKVILDQELRGLELQPSDRPVLALNCVGGKMAAHLSNTLRRHGKMVTYGAMSRQPLSVPTRSLIFNQISLHGFWMSQWYEEADDKSRHQLLDTITDLYQQQRLCAPLIDHHPLADYQEALQRTSKVGRKQVLVFGEAL